MEEAVTKYKLSSAACKALQNKKKIITFLKPISDQPFNNI